MNDLNTDIELKEAFLKLSQDQQLSNINKKLAALISDYGLNQQQLNLFLSGEKIQSLTDLKYDTQILLLAYISQVLEDYFITEGEAAHVRLLKRLFKIREGDLYKNHYQQIVILITLQIKKIYEDDKVDTVEALQKVNLQELFDLGYDQFLKIINNEVKISLSRGGRLDELDTLLPTN